MNLRFQKNIFDMFMESQYWPLDIMRDYQRTQLAQLLRHARATVPFYKTRLDPIFTKTGDIDWEHWQEIPIVTRADLRDRREEMLTTALPPGHGPSKTFYSSGSSGVPIAMESTKMWTDVNRAASQRFGIMQGIDYNETWARMAAVNENGEFFDEEFYQSQKGNRTNADRRPQTEEFVINRNCSETRKLELLRELGVAYLVDFSINAELLAVRNISLTNPVRLNAVICVGQGISQEQKNLFLESFGAKSLSIYSSKEGGFMGYQCGGDFRYHVTSEALSLEIISEKGSSCEIGERGRVIVTPFFSTALPLIRYEQGDTAEFQSLCNCTNSLPLVTKIEGRQDQILRFPEGPCAVVSLNSQLWRTNLNATAFQLAQTDKLKLEVRYIANTPNSQVNEAPIIEHIRKFIHARAEIIFKPVESIPLNSGGKQQRIVCEIA